MAKQKSLFKKTNYTRMKFVTDNISVCGHSHVLIQKECQDCSLSWTQGGNYCGAIVCDGHGGDKYIRSAIGSELACETAKKAIDGFMTSQKQTMTYGNYDEKLTVLERYILSDWREAVGRHLSENPIADDSRFPSLTDKDKDSLINNAIKAYGSTFIAAVMSDEFYFVLKIGDGNVNLISEDGTVRPAEELDDKQLQFNLTTSLCQSDAIFEFRHLYVPAERYGDVDGIVITTDGVINSYDDVGAYKSLIKNIYFAHKESQNMQSIINARKELEKCLYDISKNGSGDDMSVSVIIKNTKKR